MAIKRNGWAVSQLRNPAKTPQYSPGMRTHWPWRQLGAKVAPDIALLTEDDTGGASLAPEWRHGGATINSQNLWRQRGASDATARKYFHVTIHSSTYPPFFGGVPDFLGRRGLKTIRHPI